MKKLPTGVTTEINNNRVTVHSPYFKDHYTVSCNSNIQSLFNLFKNLY